VAAEMLLALSLACGFCCDQQKKGRLRTIDAEIWAGTSCGVRRPHAIGLLVWRVANLGWFLGFAISDWRRGGFPSAYTQWSFRLQPFYWLAAASASALHLVTRGASRKARGVATVTHATAHALFEVCLTSSWLVSLVVFTLLEPGNPSIFGSRQHFANTACLTLEFCINRVSVRAGHLLLMLLWPLCYVLFSWIQKATGSWTHFVYFFQQLDSPSALLWHPLLLMLHVLVYFAFVGCSQFKQRHRVVAVAHPVVETVAIRRDSSSRPQI